MGPLRIIILGVLLYIGYRLIAANFKKASKDDDTSSDTSAEGITDVLIEDPVCHKLVPRKQAVKAEIDEKTYFFCSAECRDKFMAGNEGDG